MLRQGGQVKYNHEDVVLSDAPGSVYYGSHKDQYVQLPVCCMWGLMLTILSDPKRTGKHTSHRVKKFSVPDHVVELLQGLPLVVGFGIRGDVLAVEDTFSLLNGRPIKLAGFIELGSLMAITGWALPTCNMPSCHALLTGSVLDKQVSRADDLLGETMETAAGVAESLHCS